MSCAKKKMTWDVLKMLRDKECLAILQACHIFNAQCQTHLLLCCFSYQKSFDKISLTKNLASLFVLFK